MLGNGMPATWPIHYPASPSSSGGGTGVAAGDAFALYPFPNGKTLVTWNDLGAGHHSALIAEDYSFLPPLVNVPSTPTTGSLMLLVGNLAWDSAYDALAPTLLPTAQQTTLARKRMDAEIEDQQRQGRSR